MLPYANQETAIRTHDRNLMVVAGAGSGKTYVLVNRYLALLDRNRNWPLNALVAITFTRKAAQEMRDRVRQELEKRYHAAQDDFDRDSWAGRIASMDSARIDTIHGLCASILRANPAEAGVDPRFEVLDEVQSARLLDDTIDAVLHAVVLENDPALELFTHYDAFAISRTLKACADADLGDLPEDLLAGWASMLEQSCLDQVRRIAGSRLAQDMLDWQPSVGWPDGKDKLLGVWDECRDLIRLLLETEAHDARLEIFSSFLNLNDGLGAAKFWIDSGSSLNEVRAPIKALKAEMALVFEQLTAVDHEAARLIPHWHSLITRVQDVYRAAKTRDAYVDFGDLERLTRDLLQRYPQVRARYQSAEFKHLLVDEFQDTNVEQWDIVRALADPARPGSLFIVGDGKQSIYQFRGADVSVFNRARAEIQAVGGQTVPLVRSFRSHRPLVDGFNHLFRQLLARDPDSIAGEYQIELEDLMEAERQFSPADVPALEFLLINQEIYKGVDSAADQCRRWEAYEIAARLHQLIEDGRPIYDKQLKIARSMGYGDVALLFRSMTDVNLYEDVFKAVAMPFVTVSGRGYYNRQEVWDLINVLTALHNPADNLRLAAALRSPLFNLSDDALLALRILKDANGERSERLPLWDALADPVGVPDDEIALVNFARACLYELRGLAGRVTISELLREILVRTGYLATLTSLPDGARRRGNVEKLLDKAETSGQVTLGAFSQYLQDMSASEVHEGEALVDVKDAVTLMTIHGSKGLEFPLVVLVDMSRKLASDISPHVMFTAQFGLTCKVRSPEKDEMVGSYAHRQAETLHKLREEAERKRLLYVAATRAQDYLIISGQVIADGTHDESGNPIWKSTHWLQTLLELFRPEGFTAAPGGSIREYAGWGQVSIIVPENPPDERHFYSAASSDSTLWDEPAVQNGEPLSAAAEEPALLRPVKVDHTSIARHLTATQIADIGGAHFDDYYRDKFRRSVLHAAPSSIDKVSGHKQKVSPRIIGEMVHGTLRWWRFPSEHDNLESVLKSYAWGLGVVDDGQQKYAIQEARKLLQQTMNSDVYRWIEDAMRDGVVYRELPFIFRGERRTVHGILDVLLQRPDGSWAIVDYKTSYVPDYRAMNLEALRHHAQRFHLQVGVYAAAVKEQLGGITPDVYIHYIRYGQSISVYAGEWELALGKIESYIGNLLDESDWVT